MLKTLICPKCTNTMSLEQRPGADFFRCSQCAGLWFNMGEHIPLEAVADSIDTGSIEQGQQYNKIDRIDCPKCHMPLIRMVDAKQAHIWYESCKNCYGRFYDAGEFRDLATFDFDDYIKQFSVTARD